MRHLKFVCSFLSLCCLFSVAWAADTKSEAGFNEYVKGLKDEALTQGFDQQLVNDALSHIQYRPTVIKADKNQPERKITLDSYLATRVPDWKVKQAVELYESHHALLTEIGTKYGVQPRFIVALWGNESNFGKIQGSHDVLSALASLAYEGRRETLFKKQFFAALTILAEGHTSLEVFKGSWAGAMGQSQFMPTSFLTYAVDYDGDGRKDIWNSYADVFASIANYLSSEGWNEKYTWGRQVKLMDEKALQYAGLDKNNFMPLSTWQRRGVRRYDEQNLPAVPINASLIMPDGEEGRIYLVYNNFHTLMRWNRSSYFGVAVGYLSDRIKRGY
ncbi:lytic murein transglycosylase [Alteromonas sp. ASW11-130]|uniref:lytic murein transglycosylase n=1 Tax=Alteromonas sp. ASW11-130 TaxID=3015775 RepID=UPI002241DEC3|nr:lytic murein transglycosylase [Alteromonas sp. ASW11-130]MCW8092549.1 lytic murein transglycosylase [Alteromonas sp. ASW11-130]